MITKGAFANIVAICDKAELPGGDVVPLSEVEAEIQSRFDHLSSQGLRVLAIASKSVAGSAEIQSEDETGMIFTGFLVFQDPPKADAAGTIQRLRQSGVTLKLITGDNYAVARQLSSSLGISTAGMLTGAELSQISDEDLPQRAEQASVFAEIEPNQKERVVLALRKSGHVVGFMGDGINDASALHAADVGISVDTAVDVARQAAHIVLLEKDLGVLLQGIQIGRAAFANTQKYVFMATSANFGNMFSMAGASLFLSFLPLLPRQILLTNLLTDLPETTIATDNVDPEAVERPPRWDVRSIRRFMLVFGALSSVFDYATFGILLLVLDASETEFRTGWFVESVTSAAVIVLVIRTRRPFFRSPPGKYLAIATVIVVSVTVALPYTQLGRVMDFTPLPPVFLGLMAAVVALYTLSAEMLKRAFRAHGVARA
jgi:Mg2+-importing ATPase